MGIISVTQEDGLYWLGRYTERVYTTIRLYAKYYDEMIEHDDFYIQFCQRMEIPNIYSSGEDFIKRYGYDKENPDSLISNMYRDYDNAVTLRELIRSSALSYVQLAVYAMNRAAQSQAPLLELQKVCDYIVAFWGIIDDSISVNQVRDLIKTGRRLERVDLYARMRYEEGEMREAIRRLTSYRLARSGLACSKARIANLEKYKKDNILDYDDIVFQVEHIFDDD